MAAQLIDYRRDDGEGRGWIVRCQWRALSGQGKGDETTQHHALLGEAHRAGYQLSCCCGAVQVKVERGDGAQLAASYERETNLWQDHDPRIRAFEAELTRRDWLGEQLRSKKELTGQDREQLLLAVSVGGNTAHHRDHPHCLQLADEGLLSWNGRRWQAA